MWALQPIIDPNLDDIPDVDLLELAHIAQKKDFIKQKSKISLCAYGKLFKAEMEEITLSCEKVTINQEN